VIIQPVKKCPAQRAPLAGQKEVFDDEPTNRTGDKFQRKYADLERGISAQSA
jgi:hypothetical protein